MRVKDAAKPIGKHTVVRTQPGGKFGNRLGIVTSIGKSKVNLILVDDVTALRATFGGLVAAENERPTATPNVEIQFKASPFGRGQNDLGELFIVDREINKTGTFDPLAKEHPAGVRSVGYKTRDDGRAYANVVGGRFLEI